MYVFNIVCAANQLGKSNNNFNMCYKMCAAKLHVFFYARRVRNSRILQHAEDIKLVGKNNL